MASRVLLIGCSHLLSWLAETTTNLADFGVIFRGQRLLYLRLTWIIDSAADQGCVDDHLKSYGDLFIRTINGRSTRVDRHVFKITSGSKQTSLDKLLFFWFDFAKICLKNWTLDTNFQAKGSTDKIIQNVQTDSVIRVAQSVVTAKTSHTWLLMVYFKPVVQCSDCTTLLHKNICYINNCKC